MASSSQLLYARFLYFACGWNVWFHCTPSQLRSKHAISQTFNQFNITLVYRLNETIMEDNGWFLHYHTQVSGACWMSIAVGVQGLVSCCDMLSGLTRSARWRASFSAPSSHVWRTGRSATMLLCDSVSDSKRQMVLWLSEPTPGSFSCPRAAPTSA